MPCALPPRGRARAGEPGREEPGPPPSRYTLDGVRLDGPRQRSVRAREAVDLLEVVLVSAGEQASVNHASRHRRSGNLCHHLMPEGRLNIAHFQGTPFLRDEDDASVGNADSRHGTTESDVARASDEVVRPPPAFAPCCIIVDDEVRVSCCLGSVGEVGGDAQGLAHLCALAQDGQAEDGETVVIGDQQDAGAVVAGERQGESGGDAGRALSALCSEESDCLSDDGYLLVAAARCGTTNIVQRAEPRCNTFPKNLAEGSWEPRPSFAAGLAGEAGALRPPIP